MSVYLAGLSQNPAASHPLFLQRKLAKYTQAPLNTLNIFGQAEKREIAYDGYRCNIDAFISSTNRQKKVATHVLNCSFEDMGRPLPLAITPTVGFVPAYKLNPESEEALLLKLAPYSPSTKKVGKQGTIVLLAAPVPSLIPILSRASVDQVNPGPEYWTPKAYQAYIFVQMIISEFLATNTYPAWLSRSQRSGGDAMELVLPAHTSVIREKRQIKDYTTSQMTKRQKHHEDTEMEAEEEDDPETIEDVYVIPLKTMQSTVLVAKPSPVPASANIGSPADVPNLPGLCFPYFDRMNIPDQITMRSILSAYFLRNFGVDRDSQLASFKTIKVGLEQMARTKEGGVLAHILTGIKLALETQTRLFVVKTNDEYSGFCLLGALFSVVVNNERFEAKPANELRDELNLMSSHNAALHSICAALSKLKIAASPTPLPPREIKEGSVKNAGQLWKEISLRELKGTEATTVAEQVGMLAFSRGYKEPTIENLLVALRKVTMEDKEMWSDEDPCFLPSQFHLYSDHVARVLAAFGPVVPSFINASGSAYVIPEKTEKDPNNEVASGGKKALPYILVALKPLHMAVIDMRKFVRERAIVMDMKERAGKNRNLVFGGAGRDILYEGLRKALYHEEASKKRKANSELGGPAEKKINSAADFLAMF